MIRETIIKFRRYFERNGALIGLSPLGLLLLTIYFRPSNSLLFVLLAVILFLIPYPFRHVLIRQIDRPLMRFFDARFLTVGIAIVVALLVLKQPLPANSVLVGFASLYFGVQFWTRTDEMYTMIAWLAFPTEYGRPPDSIRLWHKASIEWDGHADTCYLFRFIYDGEESVGITRPVAFSLMEPIDQEGPEEILERYRQWYLTTGREVLDRDTAEETS